MTVIHYVKIVKLIIFINFSGLERAECSQSDLERAKSMVPKALESYVAGMNYTLSFYL